MADGASEVSQLLLAWRNGDEAALDRLTPLVYDELRRLARGYMHREADGHLLQTTALVHEAYLRLVGQDVSWTGREHFFAVCANMMRRILVDQARRRRAMKRGGEGQRVPLHTVDQSPQPQDRFTRDRELLALDEAIEQLSAFDARKARVVELHYFGGLTIQEIGTVVEISHATVERDLKVARAWLSEALDGAP